MDGSENSLYDLEWTLDYFFTLFASNPSFEARYSSCQNLHNDGLAGPGAAEFSPFIGSDLTKIASAVVEKAKGIRIAKSPQPEITIRMETDTVHVEPKVMRMDNILATSYNR